MHVLRCVQDAFLLHMQSVLGNSHLIPLMILCMILKLKLLIDVILQGLHKPWVFCNEFLGEVKNH